jgi:TadE-like protein
MLFRSLFVMDRGSVVVEFALVIPVFFAIIFAVVDISRTFLFANYAEQILMRLSNYCRDELTLEKRQTVSQMELKSKADEIEGNYKGSLSSVAILEVTGTAFESIDDLLHDTEQMDNGLLGQPGDIVRYTLSYEFSTSTPFSNFFYPAGVVTQSVSLVVKNVN